MRKTVFIFISIFSLLIGGCAQPKTIYNKSAAFYYAAYPNSDSYRAGTMLPELREGIQYDNNLLTLVNDYLEGPVSSNLYSMIPDNVHAVSVNRTKKRIMVFMNEGFAKLTGVELSIVGSGLATTLIQFTGVPEVGICVKGCKLDGQSSIIFNEENMIFAESIIPTT